MKKKNTGKIKFDGKLFLTYLILSPFLLLYLLLDSGTSEGIFPKFSIGYKFSMLLNIFANLFIFTIFTLELVMVYLISGKVFHAN